MEKTERLCDKVKISSNNLNLETESNLENNGFWRCGKYRNTCRYFGIERNKVLISTGLRAKGIISLNMEIESSGVDVSLLAESKSNVDIKTSEDVEISCVPKRKEFSINLDIAKRNGVEILSISKDLNKSGDQIKGREEGIEVPCTIKHIPVPTQLDIEKSEGLKAFATSISMKNPQNLAVQTGEIEENSLASKLKETFRNMDIEKGEGEYEGIGVRENGHGFLYHLKLCMLCLLRSTRLYDEGSAFSMAAEHKLLNPFDDIVIMMDTGGGKQYHLLQCKHGQLQLDKKIIVKDFLKEKSNNWGNQFTLHKFFKGYCQIKRMPEFASVKTNFIVCTNIDLDFDDLKRHCFSIKSFDENHGFMEMITESKGKCFRLKSKGKSVIYKALKGNDVSDDDINNFIDDFTLAVNLPNENDLVNIIKKEIETKFNCINTELMASKFQDRLLDWLKLRKGTWLTGEDGKKCTSEIVDVINSLGSKGLDISHKIREAAVRVLEEYIAATYSILREFLNSEEHMLRILTVNSRSYLTLLKIQQTIERSIKYDSDELSHNIYSTDKVLFTRFKSFSSKESREYILSAVNSENFNLLIICSREKDKVSRYAFKYLYKVTKICTKKKKKIILITENGADVSELEEEIPALKSRQEEDAGMTFLQLTEETKHNLLSRNVVKLQGNGQKTSLASLFRCNTEERWVEIMDEITKTIDHDLLVRLIKQKQIYVGGNLKETPVLSDIYVDRKLRNEITSEIITEEDLLRNCKRFVFIIDDAGSGKSTLINSLLRKLRNSKNDLDSLIWVCRINFNYYTSVFNKELELRRSGRKSFDHNDVSETTDFFVHNFLESHPDTKLETHFEKALFKLALQGQIRLLMVFDAFDEICPNYKELATELLTSLQKTKLDRMYVTSRPLRSENQMVYKDEKMKHREETYLNVVPLSEDDQKKFLLQYWARSIGVEDERGLHKLREVSLHCRRKVDQSMLTNPLTLLMTAEHWQGTVAEVYNTLHHRDSIRLPSKLNYIDLCRYYVNKKISIYQIDKSRHCSGNISSDNKHNYFINAVNDVHTHLALTEIFGQSIAQDLKGEELRLDVYVMVELPKIGFVLESENFYRFVHKTFAEHFVTEFIRCNPKRVGSVLSTEDWDTFMVNLTYSRWDVLFECVIGGFFEVYTKSRNQDNIDRLRYILTYIALVRQLGHQTTKELTADEGPEIDAYTKESLLSLGLVKEGRQKSRYWKGFKFIYWRFAEFLVKNFIDSHCYEAVTVSNSQKANRMERYFSWWDDIVSVSSSYATSSSEH